MRLVEIEPLSGEGLIGRSDIDPVAAGIDAPHQHCVIPFCQLLPHPRCDVPDGNADAPILRNWFGPDAWNMLP